MDSTGSKESAWGGLMDRLKSTGMAVLEAGADKLGNEIVDKLQGGGDAMPTPQPAQQTVIPEYGAPVMQTGTANQAGFTIGGMAVNPLLLFGSLGLLAVALVLKARG